jgi:hypothetical protein
MKRSIEWHRECLINRNKNLEHLIIQRDRLNREIEKDKKENDFYSMQIRTAIDEGRAAFDCERYLVKRSAKEKERTDE